MKCSIKPLSYGPVSIFAHETKMMSIHNSKEAYKLLAPYFNSFVEEFWVIHLNCSLIPSKPILLSRGTLSYCFVHPRDVFREAISANAHAIIIAHNHPSLNTQPTEQDIKLTKRLVRIGKLIDLPILDHIIFTDQSYFSMKENLIF